MLLPSSAPYGGTFPKGEGLRRVAADDASRTRAVILHPLGPSKGTVQHDYSLTD